MDDDDKRMLIISAISDVIDLLPSLPFINTFQSIIDAANIQAVRTKYPDSKASTAIALLETIESPIPFIPSPLELLPSHILATTVAIRDKDKGRGEIVTTPPIRRRPPQRQPIDL